jgi:YfiH family protein
MDVAEHFFTTAAIELRDDEAEWAGVATLAGVTPERLRLLHQVHGREVAIARSRASDAWIRPTADAIVSDDPTVALVVRVADCAPILIGDRRLNVVAAVHAGWRSTMQRIAIAAVECLARAFGSRPEDLVAAIGPSLGACCGEMGEEVIDTFRANGHDDSVLARWFDRQPGRKPHFDLWAANRDQLVGVGVRSADVHIADLCTRTFPDAFHSYRARGGAAGRMAAVIRPA